VVEGEVGPARLGVERFAQRLIVLDSAGFEIGGQVFVGVTPPIGSDDQISLQRRPSRSCCNVANSYGCGAVGVTYAASGMTPSV